jgi:hypothetical protein
MGRAEPDVSAVSQASYRRRYSFPNTPTIVLSACGQIVQGDQDVDFARTKGCRKQPDAIPQARLVLSLPLTMTRALGILP